MPKAYTNIPIKTEAILHFILDGTEYEELT